MSWYLGLVILLSFYLLYSVLFLSKCQQLMKAIKLPYFDVFSVSHFMFITSPGSVIQSGWPRIGFLFWSAQSNFLKMIHKLLRWCLNGLHLDDIPYVIATNKVIFDRNWLIWCPTESYAVDSPKYNVMLRLNMIKMRLPI